MWLVLALLSALFAGLTTVLAKYGIKKIPSDVATALRTIVVLAFAILAVFIAGSQRTLFEISKKSLCFLILSGLATGASWLCYFKALGLGDINKIAPIDKSSTVISMLLAFIILGENITVLKGVSMLLITAGTYLMLDRKKSISKQKSKAWLIYALLSAVFAALTSILGKIGIEGVESNLGTAVRTAVVLAAAWAMVFIKKEQHALRSVDKKSLVFILLSGLTTGASWLCYYRALSLGEASVVVPIDKLSILVTVALSYIFFKEKLNKKTAGGLALLTLGTALLLI